MRGFGIERFVTQKLSWNLYNKFPNSTFWWESLDGSRVLTHFPPADTYNSQCTVEEMVSSVKRFKDKERSQFSLYVFGHGDGGGGPTEEMIERLRRLQNINGLPQMTMESTAEFFDRVEEEKHLEEGTASQCDFLTWVGELYFELHRGTYTTQGATKMGNRKGELLLREIEMWYSLFALNHGTSTSLPYPTEELQVMWKKLLLNQFHDVLPGSSIGEVYRDAEALYQEVQEQGQALLHKALQYGIQSSSTQGPATEVGVFVFNSLNFPRCEVVEISHPMASIQIPLPSSFTQFSCDSGTPLAILQSPGLGVSCVSFAEVTSPPVLTCPVTVVDDEETNTIYVENKYLRIQVCKQSGLITSCIHQHSQREVVAKGYKGLNQIMLFEDIPLFWDAWDVEIYHTEKALPLPDEPGSLELTVEEDGPLRCCLRLIRDLSSKSRLEQRIILTCTSKMIEFHTKVDWHENRRMLKVAFPLNVHSLQATYEVPYGLVERPTHQNTSWDMAKFEVCGHRVADLSETGFGCSVLNDCKYGYSCNRNVLSLSLLRSPKSPDDECDMGVHHFRYALYPHDEDFRHCDALQQALSFNAPLHLLMSDKELKTDLCQTPLGETPSIRVSEDNVIVDCIKKTEDPVQGASEAIIVRLYESLGRHTHCCVSLRAPCVLMGNAPSVVRCNMMEDAEEGGELDVRTEGMVVCATLDMAPYQVVTLRFAFLEAQ